jgi:organic hydroperoxide reductase OsmC/OhrA
MLFFLSLAAARGLVVDSYRDEAIGTMAKDAGGKLAMTKVVLRPDVRYGGDRRPSRAEEDALHHQAHDECFIARSVRTAVTCEPARPRD